MIDYTKKMIAGVPISMDCKAENMEEIQLFKINNTLLKLYKKTLHMSRRRWICSTTMWKRCHSHANA